MTATAGAPDIFTPVLARLHADAAAHFGIASLRLVPSGRQDRPASHLLRLDVCRDGDDSPLSHLFLKVFKPKDIEGGLDAMRQRVERDYETTRRIYTAMLHHSDLGVVPPVACYPDHLAIVTEQVNGPTLLDHLRTEASWSPSTKRLAELRETMERVGRWIRVFQSTGSAGGRLSIDDLRQYIDIRLERLVRHAGPQFTQNHRERVLRHVDRLGRRVAPEELDKVPVHADMALGNIIVSGHRIVVLDFAMAQRGTHLHDLTRLFLQVELLGIKPQLRMSVVRSLQRAQLAGFDPKLTADHPLFRLLLLLHRVNHLTTLTVTHAGFPESLYNRVVHRRHRRSIAEELERGDNGLGTS